jgi:hypothetical protein
VKPKRALSMGHRFLAGVLSKDQSIATGIVLGLIVWTMTRLVDGVTGSGTIEYDTVVKAAMLADGRMGSAIVVTLSNLSRDTPLVNLQASVSDPSGKVSFSTDAGDRACAFEPPAWGENPTCDPYSTGFDFLAPMLVPGTRAQFGIKYTVPSGEQIVPVVRIKPDGTTKFRLIKPGIETFIVRHETGLLLGLLGVTLVLFLWSVSATVSEGPKKRSTEK